MRLIHVIAIGVCAVLLALANESPRTSNVAQLDSPKQMAARVIRGDHEGQVSAEEWTEIEGWMKLNCPNRLGFLSNMADGQGQKEHAKQLMAEQYRQIKHTTYKPLQDALVQQAQAQDLIFGAQVKLREARHEGRSDKPQREVAKAQLHTAVGKLFDAEVQEKSARVGRLESEIDDMRKNRATLIEKWTHGLMTRAGAAGAGTGSTVPDPESSSPGETGSSPTE